MAPLGAIEIKVYCKELPLATCGAIDIKVYWKEFSLASYGGCKYSKVNVLEVRALGEGPMKDRVGLGLHHCYSVC